MFDGRCLTIAFLAIIITCTLTACRSSTTPDDDGSIGGPPPPSGPSTPIVSVSTLQRASSAAGWFNFVDRPVTVSWPAIAGASSYRVEIGTSPGLSDLLSVTTPGTSITRTLTSPGTWYPKVTALTANGNHPSNDRLPLVLFRFDDYVEALFLGTGPLAQAPQSGCLAGTGVMTSWPSDSTVTVTLTSSLNAAQKSRALTAVAQTAQATAGAYRAAARDASEPHPAAGTLEIVAQQADVTFPFPCSPEALGCAVPLQFSSPGVLARAHVVMNGTSTRIGHELGHALFGFCHLNAQAGLVSVMGSFDDDGRGLSEADLEATAAVYRAGIRGGARRMDFVAAGLIRP